MWKAHILLQSRSLFPSLSPSFVSALKRSIKFFCCHSMRAKFSSFSNVISFTQFFSIFLSSLSLSNIDNGKIWCSLCIIFEEQGGKKIEIQYELFPSLMLHRPVAGFYVRAVKHKSWVMYRKKSHFSLWLFSHSLYFILYWKLFQAGLSARLAHPRIFKRPLQWGKTNEFRSFTEVRGLSFLL
jgi:hypothetical protein